MPRQRSTIIFALLLSTLFGMTPARSDDAATCRTWTGQEALAACTRMITSDTLHGADLAQAYLWRGITRGRNTGDWDAAIADFSEAISLGSKDAGAYAGRAGAYIRKGEIDRALPDLNQGLALDPKHAGVRNVFAYYYLKRGDYGRALTEVNESIRLSPRYLYAFSTRADIYEAKGELNNALADFRTALGLDPDKKQRGGRYAADGIARVEGKLFAAAGADWATCQRAPSLEDGIAACTRLISAKKLGDVDLAQVYVWRGIGVGRYRGDVDLAIADYDEALRRDSKIVAAYAGRGGSYVRKGKLDLARRDLDEGLKLDPNHSGVHNALGNYYLAKGDHGSAIAEFNTAIRIAPQYLYPYRFRAEANENRGDLAAALADYKIALSLDPGKQQVGGKEAAEGIARVEKKLAEGADKSKASADDATTCKTVTGEAAVAACTRIISANASRTGELAQAYMWRGLAHLRSGDWDRTIADSTEAIRIGTKDSAAYCARAEAYVFRGEIDRARSDLDRARALGPDRAILRNALGVYDLAKGDYAAAIGEFNTAARLFPQSLYSYRYRGEAYEKKGDLALALADYRVALGLDPTKQQIGGREAAEGIARVEQKLAQAADKSKVAVAEPKAVPVEPKASPAPPKAAVLGHRVALVIGNSKYLYANKLPNPANDAADISRVLRTLGFDVIEGRDLDRRGMEDKIRAFGRKLEAGADLALLFYAGHGMQVGGRNYLIPVDAKLERSGDLTLDTIELGQILAQMEAEKRVNLVFLDACRDNPLARSFARSLGTRSAAVGSGLAPVQSAIGTMIAYATQPDNVALDGEGRNSPFTTALLKYIATPKLEIGSIMKRVRADVIATTREKQVPWDHSSLVGDVILVP